MTIHAKARAVGLIFHYHEWPFEGEQVIILVDKHIFISQSHIAFALEQGIFGIAADDVGAVNQLLVALASACVIVGESGRFHAIESTSYNGAVLGGVEANYAGIAVGAVFFPEVDNLLYGIIGHIVVAIDASIEFGGDIAVCCVVSSMHSLIFLVDILNRDNAIGNPLFDKLASAIGGTVVNNQPDEVLARLTAKALVGARYGVRAVVGGSKYC